MLSDIETTADAAPDGAAFVVNMDRSTGRMARAREALEGIGMNAIRVPGVDGKMLTDAERSRYDEAGALRLLGRPLLDGEIGCALGHLRALEAVVASGRDMALVLEDDFGLHPGLADVVGALRSVDTSRWEVANLIHVPDPWLTPVAEVTLAGASHAVARAHQYPTDASAVVWTAAGAVRMLEDQARIREPWDHAIRRFAMRADTGLCLVPPLARQRRDEGSEIGGTGARRVLRRTPRYRLTRLGSLGRNKARAASNLLAWRAGRRP